MEMLVTAALIVVLAHLALGVILWLRVRKLYSYPGLLGFPVIGNLYYFYRTLFLGSMDSMEKYMVRIAEKYGKNGMCFHWVYGFRTSMIVASPHVVQEIAFHPNLTDKPYSMYGGFTPYSSGPFASSRADDLWKLKRKEYNSCLKRSHVDSYYYNVFIKCADKVVDLMLATSCSVDLHPKTIGVTQHATVESLFGVETSLVYHPDVIKVMTQVIDIGSFIWANPKLAEILLTILRPIDAFFFGKLADLRKSIVKGIENTLVMDECRIPERSLSMQIALRNIKYNGSQNTLKTELEELFFTSSHPLSSALSNSIVFLALLPDIQERAFQEQYEIFRNDNRDPTIDDLEQMQFLDRFIKESFRFLSPPFIGKLATGDINIDGITIPSGAIVVFLLKSMRMDPNHWKNPNIFDPDRFLEENDTLKHSYSPFGIGIRSCPGMYFATLLMKITLSKILRRLKLKPVQKNFRFKDIHYKCCIMTELVNPPELQVEERA
ncbi:cytochrome P450 4c21 [Halyomorpha halys]|uniref:cytochrome P450 4c21 n=1 Tax=Halyomorpha halys TaxID=286706 RepID=UPI0006D4D3F2|nr:cytochrome P450 4c21 [Halyomorpha halys]